MSTNHRPNRPRATIPECAGHLRVYVCVSIILTHISIVNVLGSEWR